MEITNLRINENPCTNGFVIWAAQFYAGGIKVLISNSKSKKWIEDRIEEYRKASSMKGLAWKYKHPKSILRKMLL